MSETRTMADVSRAGWASRLAVIGMFVLLFEGFTGLLITFGPFHDAIQYGVLLHTLVGVFTLLPIAWYLAVHWLDYKSYSLSHVVLLGYVATIWRCSSACCPGSW